MLPPLLDESRPDALISLSEGAEAGLSQLGPERTDPAALIEALCRLPGADRLRVLRIEPGSGLEDLSVLRAFPALEVLHVYGGAIRSLKGIEQLQHGKYLEIDTGKNKKRDLAGIEACPAPRVAVRWAREEDLEHLGGSRGLAELTLLGNKTLDVGRLERSPLTHLSLIQSSLEALEDTEKAPSLESLHLKRCRKLTALEGRHGRIQRLIVDGCPALDLSSLSRLGALESLTVVGQPGEVRLSAFAGLQKVRFLSIQGSKTAADLEDLLSTFPTLETLYLSKQKPAALGALRDRNPNVEIKGDAIF